MYGNTPSRNLTYDKQGNLFDIRIELSTSKKSNEKPMTSISRHPNIGRY